MHGTWAQKPITTTATAKKISNICSRKLFSIESLTGKKANTFMFVIFAKCYFVCYTNWFAFIQRFRVPYLNRQFLFHFLHAKCYRLIVGTAWSTHYNGLKTCVCVTVIWKTFAFGSNQHRSHGCTGFNGVCCLPWLSSFIEWLLMCTHKHTVPN